MTGTVASKILTYGRMIKFSHTLFALPFAMAAWVIAWQTHDVDWTDLIWVVLAMVGARSAAMGFNRIVDARFDGRNPRTAGREIPAGRLGKKEAMLFVLVSGACFVFAAAMLSRLCFFLSFPVLFFLLVYSLTKRFTTLCHLFLGFAISLAPAGTFLAVTDTLNIGIICLSLALMTYIAGFDILYACQDIAFDRENALFSIPASLGAAGAMTVSGALHWATVVLFILMAVSLDMHPVFLVFLAVIGGLLIYEHRLVRPDCLDRIDTAFFHVNAVISVLVFAGILFQALLIRNVIP